MHLSSHVIQLLIICMYFNKIFKRQRLHPKYTWITYGWYAQASWTNGDFVNCTEVQLKMVLKNGISVEVFPIPEDTNASTLAGLVRANLPLES